jgi:hypothetical protein
LAFALLVGEDWMSSDSVSEDVVLLYVIVVETFEATLAALTRSGDKVCSGPESLAGGILKALEESVLLGIESGGRCVIAMLSLFLPKNANMGRPIEGGAGEAGLSVLARRPQQQARFGFP